MLFEYKELDYMATKKRVNLLMEKYERALMRIHSKSHPKITQTYTMDVSSPGGFSSKTEEAAIYKIEGIESDLEFVKRVADCVNRLASPYREIIVLTFFEELRNKEVADELGISVSLLSIRKRSAIELFAYGAGVEVYKVAKIK